MRQGLEITICCFNEDVLRCFYMTNSLSLIEESWINKHVYKKIWIWLMRAQVDPNSYYLFIFWGHTHTHTHKAKLEQQNPPLLSILPGGLSMAWLLPTPPPTLHCRGAGQTQGAFLDSHHPISCLHMDTRAHTHTHWWTGLRPHRSSSRLVPLGCWPCRSGTCCSAKYITMLDFRSDTFRANLPARRLLAWNDSQKSQMKEFCFSPTGSELPPGPPDSLLHFLSPLLAPVGSYYYSNYCFSIITSHTFVPCSACVFSSVRFRSKTVQQAYEPLA